ncbi:hypothetical protein D9V28_06880 [Mycetocola zhadangensis]|uniref:Uncharacterized protein n=1 Tax=Mycetocola zhadangensis TaxID=1164595 RepID=A0A3L7J0I1_9MICO|nr:hypothetical protein D9V28_06880 [Mycetocola zhadangensis]
MLLGQKRLEIRGNSNHYRPSKTLAALLGHERLIHAPRGVARSRTAGRAHLEVLLGQKRLEIRGNSNRYRPNAARSAVRDGAEVPRTAPTVALGGWARVRRRPVRG